MQKPSNQQNALENDPRLPSGEWTGFFLQPRLYTGRMGMSLSLIFKKNRISGEGVDTVGGFIVRGRYDLETDEVIVHKRYVGAHDVSYRGFAEGVRKGVWGVWEIPLFDRGGFHIWPKKYGEECGLTEGSETDLPVEHVITEDEPLTATADVG